MDASLPPNGQVKTTVVSIDVKGASVPAVAKWVNPTTLNLNGAQPQMQAALRTLIQGGPILFTLAGGLKDPEVPTTPVMKSADGRRLDGEPPNGTGTLAASGMSGNGFQGGDFTWPITVGAG